MKITDHLQISSTPTCSMSLQQLEVELSDLRNMEVDTTAVSVGAYRRVVENRIQSRMAEVSNAIKTNNYSQEV